MGTPTALDGPKIIGLLTTTDLSFDMGYGRKCSAQSNFTPIFPIVFSKLIFKNY